MTNNNENSLEKELHMIQVQQSELKQEQNVMKKEIIELQVSDKLQNKEIDNINSFLREIKDDTKFIKRSVQGSVISLLLGFLYYAVVGGI